LSAPRRPAARPRGLRALLRDSRGSATVEFALWVPALVAMLMSVADLALIFTTNANMQHAARETARELARHQITAQDAPTFLRQRLTLGSGGDYQVTVADAADVEVEVRLPAQSAAVFGFFEVLMPGDLVARAVMRREDPA
jgi:Flp pilus assembly pilin Flp